MIPCAFLDAIDTRSKFYDVAVHLKYPFLAPEELNENSVVCFNPFTDKASDRREEKIFRNLLAYRACASHWFVRSALVGSACILDRFPVKTVMLKEALVLGGDACFIE